MRVYFYINIYMRVYLYMCDYIHGKKNKYIHVYMSIYTHMDFYVAVKLVCTELPNT